VFYLGAEVVSLALMAENVRQGRFEVAHNVDAFQRFADKNEAAGAADAARARPRVFFG
jgi:hypothetical protein